MKDNTQQQIAMQVSRNTIIGNILLFLLKLYAGIVSRSGAMISDAVHTASDIISTIIVMIGIKLSVKKADKKHPYGHERLECLAAILLAGLLCATGVGIGYTGILKIMQQNFEFSSAPATLALIAAIISLIVKEGMYWYTRFAAKKINSGALMADAWHHRSDALSSIGSFIGILGSMLGFPILDPLASLVICAFIIKASIDIFIDSARKLTDEACDEETERKIHSLILEQEGVLEIDTLKTRKFGNKFYIDVEIRVPSDSSLKEAHSIAQNVHDTLEAMLPDVKHCMVHVNP